MLGAGWTPAHSLRIGDVLLSHDGQHIAVDGVADSGRIDTVYNVEVERDHTYFVGCDQTWGWSVWAHNNNGGCINPETSLVFQEILKQRGLAAKNGGLYHAKTGRRLSDGEVADVLRTYEQETAAIQRRVNTDEGGGTSALDVASRRERWKQKYGDPETAVESAEVAPAGTTGRRFDTDANIKDAKKNGITFDPQAYPESSGIPFTHTTIKPARPDWIREAFGARAVDAWIDFNLSGKRILRVITGKGHREIRVQESIMPEDFVDSGRVSRN